AHGSRLTAHGSQLTARVAAPCSDLRPSDLATSTQSVRPSLAAATAGLLRPQPPTSGQAVACSARRKVHRARAP
ncbi:MAG TPA: hypothetical protein VF294_11110, partial [Polyangiaceae bacterium]